MKNCGRRNVRKHREIKNGEQYIIFDISSKIDFLDKRGFTSSESKGCTVGPGNGLTKSMSLSTKIPNKKQKESFPITNINKQDFGSLIKKFYNSPYLGYKSIQVHNEPTEDYFFLIKYITKIIKSERHVR